jgi:hypothetical protein
MFIGQPAAVLLKETTKEELAELDRKAKQKKLEEEEEKKV